MQYLTLQDLLDRLNQRLNLTDEAFITEDEKINYINEAVKKIEGEIHKLNLEDNYFQASMLLPLEAGVSEYALPSNIYANKINQIIYSGGDTTIYEIQRMRRQSNQTVAEQIAWIERQGPQEFYQYIVKNDSAQIGNYIVLYPASRETSSENVTLWYTRSANTLAVPTDVCDIPEGYPYVIQYAKCECLSKELFGQVPPQELAKLQALEQSLIDYLTEMVPDQNNQIDQDLSFYNQFDYYQNIYGYGAEGF